MTDDETMANQENDPLASIGRSHIKHSTPRPRSYLPLRGFRCCPTRSARNLLIGHVRRRSHDALIRVIQARRPQEGDGDPLAQIAAEIAPPEAPLQRSELSELVSELLTELPEDQRLTFVLHHQADLPLAEVAEIMETSVATTKSRLRLAREKLAEKLRLRGVQTQNVP